MRVDQTDNEVVINYLVLAGCSIAAGVVGALDQGGLTELAPPARVTVTSEAPSLQYRDLG